MTSKIGKNKMLSYWRAS